jgi:hypothetical protein
MLFSHPYRTCLNRRWILEAAVLLKTQSSKPKTITHPPYGRFFAAAGAFAKHPQAVDKVGEHVQQQAYGQHADGLLRDKEHDHIQPDGRQGMQGVIANAAALCTENGSGQQMVGIYQHAQQH